MPTSETVVIIGGSSGMGLAIARRVQASDSLGGERVETAVADVGDRAMLQGAFPRLRPGGSITFTSGITARRPLRGGLLAAAAMSARLPVGRIGRADDIADAVAFLMRNHFTTGTILEVDGGHELV